MDKGDLDKVCITMDLPRLGELIGAIATELCEIRDLEPPDYDGDEMKKLAIAGWQYVCFMHDRADFAKSVSDEIASLPGVSEQLHEFGGAAPLGWNPPVV